LSKITNRDPTAPKTGCRPIGRSFVEISNGKSSSRRSPRSSRLLLDISIRIVLDGVGDRACCLVSREKRSGPAGAALHVAGSSCFLDWFHAANGLRRRAQSDLPSDRPYGFLATRRRTSVS